MSTVHLFPASSPPRRCLARARPACRAAEIDVAGIAAKLRMGHFAMRTIIDKIRLLIATAGFPEPRTPRFVGGRRQTGADAVWARSRWDRDEVEDWFDDDLPPATAAARADADQAATRARLAARAREMAA